MKIVHTFINNMGIDTNNPDKITFADRWGLTSLKKLGHKITLICGSKTPRRKEYFWKGIKVIELPTSFELTDSSRITNGLIKELIKIKADIFHTHHYGSFIPEITVIIGKIKKIPTFLTIHTDFGERKGIMGILLKTYSVVMQPFLGLYSKIFFISKYIKNKTEFKLLKQEKKILLYNQFVKPPVIRIKKTENSILFIGRIAHVKGIDILIKIMAIIKKEIPNIKLNIVGGGLESYKKILNKIIIKKKVKKNIKFYGKLYGKEKWKQFYSNTILIIPSRKEGFGNVAIEGMLCKIPVVVSNNGALPEAVNKYGIIINIKDIPGSAKKIINLLKNKNLRKNLPEKAKKYAEKFTEEKLGKILIEEYKKAIKNGKRI